MDQDLKVALKRFYDELKKDIYFFGPCGALVALFMVWQSRLTELGIANHPNWANDLFKDFVSFNAFALIFFGHLLISAIANVCAGLGYKIPKLDLAVMHLETRLAQIASSIVSFLLGLLGMVVLYSVLNLDGQGVKLIFLALIFSFLIVGSWIAAVSIGRRTQPYDKWWVSAIAILVIIGIFGWLLIQTGKGS